MALRPSRYCPSDQLEGFATTEFDRRCRARELVGAVADWVHRRLVYTTGSSRPVDTAVDTLLTGQGVCRDYAHLTITLLRALEVPARLVAVYAPGLSPMDFHAVVEADVDGTWCVVDPTRLAPTDLPGAHLLRARRRRHRVPHPARRAGQFEAMTVTATTAGALPTPNAGSVPAAYGGSAGPVACSVRGRMPSGTSSSSSCGSSGRSSSESFTRLRHRPRVSPRCAPAARPPAAGDVEHLARVERGRSARRRARRRGGRRSARAASGSPGPSRTVRRDAAQRRRRRDQDALGARADDRTARRVGVGRRAHRGRDDQRVAAVVAVAAAADRTASPRPCPPRARARGRRR